MGRLTETTAAKSWDCTAFCCCCPLHLTPVRRHVSVPKETSASFHSGILIMGVKFILPAPLSTVLMASLGAAQQKKSVSTASVLAKTLIAAIGKPINETVASSTNATKERDPVKTLVTVGDPSFVLKAALSTPVHLELTSVAINTRY